LTEIHDELSALSAVNTGDSDSENYTHSDDENSTQDVTSPSPDLDHASRAPTPMGPPTPAPTSSHIASGSGYTVTKTGYKRRLTPQAQIGKQLLDLEKERLALKKNAISHDHNDEDIGFFNSLLPHVKKLSPKDKFFFE
jgi:hypothetical protein